MSPQESNGESSIKPNLAVKEGLDHLAQRLDPIIGQRLAPQLGGAPWVAILELLDEKKGFSKAFTYMTVDLQAQLRILTERLGSLGFPFDDKQRTVSTLGGELRIVRNQLAHMYDFSLFEAFRANDYCVRLLEHFADDEAALEEARMLRHRVLAALAAAEGITQQAVQDSSATAAAPVDSAEVRETATEAELVSPDPAVLVRDSGASVIGGGRLLFEPWPVVSVGGVDVLDDLPKKVAKEQVRAVAIEIATFEGPVHLDRLVERTAQSFGLKRVRLERAKKIAYQVKQTRLVVDDDKFVWPSEIDPETWREFRPNDSAADRPFTQVSPVEIANAWRFIESKNPEFSDAELDAAALRTFGRKRKTKQIASHLTKAKTKL